MPQPTTPARIDPIRIQGIAKVLELLIVRSFKSSNRVNEKTLILMQSWPIAIGARNQTRRNPTCRREAAPGYPHSAPIILEEDQHRTDESLLCVMGVDLAEIVQAGSKKGAGRGKPYPLADNRDGLQTACSRTFSLELWAIIAINGPQTGLSASLANFDKYLQMGQGRS